MKIKSNDNKELKTEEICNGIKKLTEEDLESVNGGQQFDGMWITKAEYEESGPTIVHRKGF